MRLNFRPLGLLENRKKLTAKLLRWRSEDLHFFRWVVRHALYGSVGLGWRDEDSILNVDGWLAIHVVWMPRNVSDLLPDAHPCHGRPTMVVMLDNQDKSLVATNPIALVAQRPPKKFGRNGGCKNCLVAGFCIDHGLDKQALYETGIQRNVFFGGQRFRRRGF